MAEAENPDEVKDTNSSVWTDEQEMILKKWGEQAKSLSWMHGKCETWFNFWDKIIGIPAGVLAVVLSISIFATSTDVLWVRIVYGVVSFLVGSLVFLQNFLAWSKRSAEHRDGRINYEVLADDIESEMALDRASRISSRVYYRTMKSEQKKLTLAGYPAVIKRYIDEYKRRFHHQSIAHPINTDNLTEIVINTEDNPTDRPGGNHLTPEVISQAIEKEANDPTIRYELDRYHDQDEK